MLHLSITSTTRIGKTRDEGEHGDERGRERERERDISLGGDEGLRESKRAPPAPSLPEF